MVDAYNGWTNRETWLINVWFNPESQADVEFARDVINEQYENLPCGVLKDMIAISRIDWDELLEHFEEDEEDIDD